MNIPIHSVVITIGIIESYLSIKSKQMSLESSTKFDNG